MGTIEMFSPTYFPGAMKILLGNLPANYLRRAVMVRWAILRRAVVIVVGVVVAVSTVIRCRQFDFSMWKCVNFRCWVNGEKF